MPRAWPGASAWKLVFTSQPRCPGTGHSAISTFENKTLAHLPREETEAQRCKTLTQGQRPQSGQGQSKDPALVTAGSLASPRAGRVPRAPAAQVGERSTKVPAVRGQPGTTHPGGVRAPRAVARRLRNGPEPPPPPAAQGRSASPSRSGSRDQPRWRRYPGEDVRTGAAGKPDGSAQARAAPSERRPVLGLGVLSSSGAFGLSSTFRGSSQRPQWAHRASSLLSGDAWEGRGVGTVAPRTAPPSACPLPSQGPVT